MSENRAKLAKKITAIGKEIGKIEAQKSNLKYQYIGYEQLNAILRNELDKYGVALIPSISEYNETVKLQGTREVIRTVVKGKMLIIDTETGETIEVDIIGADQDFGGKSCGQAITEAVKRFELKLFHVSTMEDVDPDSRTVETRKKEKYESMPFSESCIKILKLSPEKVIKVARGITSLQIQEGQGIDSLSSPQEKYIEVNKKWFIEKGCGL